jgi:hypothetical protein
MKAPHTNFFCVDETTTYELFFLGGYIDKHVQCTKREEEVLIHATKKWPHITPFFKVRASKRNSSKFFSFKKNYCCAHKQARGTPPPKFSTWSPPPPFPLLFSFFFWERAGGRAGGRTGVSFSRVHGTRAGHHPGAGTKARFSHGCNSAHATGGRD